MDYSIEFEQIENKKAQFEEYQKDFNTKKGQMAGSEFALCTDPKIKELYQAINSEMEQMDSINSKMGNVWASFLTNMKEKENSLTNFNVANVEAPIPFEGEIEPIVDEKIIPVLNGDKEQQKALINEFGVVRRMLPPRKTGKANYENDPLYIKWSEPYANWTIWCTGYVAARVEEGTGHQLPTDLGNANNWPDNASAKYGYRKITNLDDVQAGDPVSLVNSNDDYHIIICEGRDENGVPYFSDGHTTRHEWGALFPFNEWSDNGWKFNGAVDVHGIVNGEYTLPS